MSDTDNVVGRGGSHIIDDLIEALLGFLEEFLVRNHEVAAIGGGCLCGFDGCEEAGVGAMFDRREESFVKRGVDKSAGVRIGNGKFGVKVMHIGDGKTA